ncbi:FAD-dependent oxidoreductase [Falsirhodobacter halotolerans]|uniref:FAD-dependent oxidoreductase n=1 Tax=Falsirhodobacter halotolerans TaxID=1146892 RepID=UPI001FD1B83D|nr:FAD-dependent oxidoreductase [Falsirhodobacter halotolerans]MCJ8139001.1 FAD-dependent oxidoreductase [Falsirhodobacter halotolerans]
MITVQGAGVLGLCIATELRARGVPVQIAARPPGPEACSWYAGGMLAPFCEGETAEEPVLRLGQEAVDWWAAAGVPVTRRGTLVISPARDRADLERFARRTTHHRRVTGEDIAALEPALAGRFREGLFFEGEAHLSPRTALSHLVARLTEGGVRFDAPLDGRIVDTRGRSARDRLPDLRGVRGEMVVLRCPEVTLTRPLRLLHSRIPLYLVPRGDGIYMLGATMVESGATGPITARALLEMLSAAYALHPALAEGEVIETGANARPAFPDNLPRLRRIGGTLFANGLHRHGFLLAPAMARMAADHLTQGTIPEFMDEHHD